MFTLQSLGWTPARQTESEKFFTETPNTSVARVATVERGAWLLIGDGWRSRATCAGRLFHHSADPTDLPAVGDWVLATRTADAARIERVLPRTSRFARKGAGGDDGQIVAANLDTVFVVTAVGEDFNPRRIERYVAAVIAGGAEAAIVVNKCDLPYDPLDLITTLERAAPGVPTAFVSATSGEIQDLERLLVPGQTAALVGSSGVGKSTLVNALLGDERQDTGGVRRGDEKGRHTTTRRELFLTPNGAIVVDTPGMRELGLFNAEEAVESAFSDVEALVATCRFNDCSHENEVGCAVLEAVESGALSQGRYESYRKLIREAAYERRKHDRRAALAERKKWKHITQSMRRRKAVDRKFGGDG